MYSGAITALITPMRDGKVALTDLKEFVEFQISEGINGVVPCGTTGESVTLSDKEQFDVIRTTVEQTKKRVPVIAGAGANCTEHAIKLSRMAAEAGADALLHVTPYYNKPTQAGLVAHYKAIATAVKLPIVLYNVPGRTGCDMLPETVAELATIPNIVAIKEATGSVARGQAVLSAVANQKMAVLSGDDATCMALTALGGTGVISVVSNIIPKQFAQLIALTRAGKIAEAQKLHYQYLTLIDAMFIESNPIPVKAAASMMGFGANELRLPLLPLEGEKLQTLRAEMKRLKLVR